MRNSAIGMRSTTEMVTLLEVLKRAESEGVAIGHFNISDTVTLKAVFESARDQKVPVVVGLSEGNGSSSEFAKPPRRSKVYARNTISQFL